MKPLQVMNGIREIAFKHYKYKQLRDLYFYWSTDIHRFSQDLFRTTEFLIKLLCSLMFSVGK